MGFRFQTWPVLRMQLIFNADRFFERCQVWEVRMPCNLSACLHLKALNEHSFFNADRFFKPCQVSISSNALQPVSVLAPDSVEWTFFFFNANRFFKPCQVWEVRMPCNLSACLHLKAVNEHSFFNVDRFFERCQVREVRISYLKLTILFITKSK